MWRSAPLYSVGLFCACGCRAATTDGRFDGSARTTRSQHAARRALAGPRLDCAGRPDGGAVASPAGTESARGRHRISPRRPTRPDATVAVPQPVRRIVSLAPNLTETLFALGLGDRVVGVTDFCDYPPEAATREHVGGPVTSESGKSRAVASGPGAGHAFRRQPPFDRAIAGNAGTRGIRHRSAQRGRGDHFDRRASPRLAGAPDEGTHCCRNAFAAV